MLLTKTVKIKIINFNIDYYTNKGYYCKIGDIIDVKVEDVSAHSKEHVEILCDECKTNKKDISIELLNQQKCYKNDKYICPECNKKILNSRKCEICGDTYGVTFYSKTNQLLCNKHKQHLRKYGTFKRTCKDSNDIRIFNTYAEFDTYNRQGEITSTFKVDLDIVDFVKNNKIFKHTDGYATYKIKESKNKNMRLHRYIMGVHNSLDKTIVVDHINRDKSDNRRENLRLVSYLDNVVNTDLLITNTSGHKGISWNKGYEKWEAYIHKNNKKINLGYYDDFNRAVQVREIAEIIYFGKNNPNYGKLINKYINNKEVQNYLLNNESNITEKEE